jgi:hypothetical protein
VITSWQRRENDRRGFLHGYDRWVERRVQENGGVGWLVRREIELNGHARVTFKVDTRYQRKARRYRAYAMKRGTPWATS